MCRYEVMRPERPKRQHSYGTQATESPASSLKSGVVEVVRFAKKNSLPLHEVDKLSQVGMSNSYVSRRQASLPLHALDSDCDPRPQCKRASLVDFQ